MILPFGPWEPDSAAINARDQSGAAVLSTAQNVYATKVGYAPVNSMSAVSTSALPTTCKGVVTVQDATGNYQTFAGTTTKLYKFVSGVWTDYTRTAGGNYSVPTSDYWSFELFGTLLIAVNLNDDPQVIDISSVAVNFSALGGSPPKARYVKVVGDFVVLACLSTNYRKLRNSAINDSTGWTVGTNLCDEQEFPDGGQVTGITGGEFGYILQQKMIRRMIFQPGSDTAFRFEKIDETRGSTANYGYVSNSNGLFFVSDDGFWHFNGQQLRPIGGQRVNQWFTDNSDANRFFATLAFVDPFESRIYWAFFATAGANSLNQLLVYNWQLDRWTYISGLTVQYWAQLLTSATSLEDLDVYGTIEDVPYPLDSRVWQGGRQVVGGVDSDGKLSFLEGTTPLVAVLTTAPMEITPGARSNVSGVRPIGVFNDAPLEINVRRREYGETSFTGSSSPVSTMSGRAYFKRTGRVHVFDVGITQTSGTTWDHVQGIDIDARPEGRK